MKITFVLPCPNLAGGIRVIGIYAKLLQRRGHQITFVSMPNWQISLMDQVKSVLKGKGLSPQFPKYPPSHLDGLTVEHRRLDRRRPIIDADVPDGDVVIATWWETAPWVHALSPSKGTKAFLIQHYEVFDYMPVDEVKAAWALPIHKIVIAQWLAKIAVEEYGDRTASCIPNGVDNQQFFAPPRTKQPLPTVGMMYSHEEWKGSDIALKAYDIAKATLPDLQLVVFGKVDTDIPGIPLPKGVRYYMLPDPPTLRSVYAQCDAWLFSSRFEGFGLPILEAMACRTPVIGTPAGAAPELLANGSGILVKPEDPEDMARAIVQVAHMAEADWQHMSDRAHEQALQNDWEVAADKLEVALLRLANAKEVAPMPPSLDPLPNPS